MPIVDSISFDLTIVWACIMAFSVLVYVVLDGFDLGIGMLFAAEPEEQDRDVVMNTVAPVWDGNETWLVLGGGGLMAAFPLAYAVVLPALYIPLIIMLLALIFRGVAFEFRWRAGNWRGTWDYSFIAGSAVATFSQGIVLGALLQGIEVDKAARSYDGGWWDWLTPFSVTVGFALMAGYMLLGATWVMMKTEGPIQQRMRKRAWPLVILTVGFIALVSLWTPNLQEGYYAKWYDGWGLTMAAGVAMTVGLLTLLLFRSLTVYEHEYLPFILALLIFGICFAGLGISMFPYIVPTEITIWEAAAPEKSQRFMLAGTLFLIPLILGYTAYSYWIFRGKVSGDTGYH